MNNIIESIESIINIKNDLKNSINNKNINVENYTFSNYSNAINTYSSNKYTPEYFSFSYYPYNTIDISTINLNHLESTVCMFGYCYNLTSVPNFNTSNTINMSNMFKNCYNLITIPNFDTSNVASMSSMFEWCNKITSVPNFNTSNVTDMTYLFSDCNNLTTVPDFDTSKVTSMSSMFYDCYNLTSISNFNTSNVISMSMLFDGCNKLTSIPNFDTSKVTSMSSMFGYCYNLTSVPNFNTSNTKYMDSMFQSCPNITSVPNFNTSKVTSMYSMFRNCYNLTSIPNFDTSNVTNIQGMFSGCNNLVDIPQFDNLTNVYSILYTFQNCSNLSHNSIVNALNSFRRIPRTFSEYYSNIYITGLTNIQLFSYVEPIYLENIFTNFYMNNLPVSFSTSKKLSNHDCMSGVTLNFTYSISNAAQARDFINLIQNLPCKVAPEEYNEAEVELVKFYPKYTYKNMEPTESDIINNGYYNSSGAIYATIEGGMGGKIYYQLFISAINILNPEYNNTLDWNTYSNCHFEEWLAEVAVYSSNNTVSEYYVNPNIQLPDYIGRTYIQSNEFKNSPLYSNISFNGYLWS